MLSRKSLNIAITMGVLASPAAMAEQLWSDASLTYLNGNKYEVGDNSRQVLTFEHATGQDWGDTFFFMDHLVSANGDRDTYFELSPRLSLNHLAKGKLVSGEGLVKDVYLAGTLEGGSGFTNTLAGVGVGLNVPKFKYFNVNLYKANNGNGKDNDEQVTFTWGLPFKVGSAEFLYDGFLDASSKADDHAAETNFTSQLKWDAGKQLFHTKKPIYIGLEYAHWKNKFGIDGVTEKNPSFLIKAHF